MMDTHEQTLCAPRIVGLAAKFQPNVMRGCLALLLIVTLIGLSRAGYCQDGTSLMHEIIQGGPSQPMFELQNEWLKGLHISGFLQNTSGIWVNPHGIRTNTSGFLPAVTATNFLASERNLLQIDANYVLPNDNANHFFLRFWGVYEPQYAYNQHYQSSDAVLNLTGNRQGCPFGLVCTASSAADYYNDLEFHEAWWRADLGPLRIFTGRQIVTWGESLAFRVGDVINPQDFSWNFGFASLEQNRIPLYMLHPILNLPGVGPVAQNFLEGIFVPAWQPCQSNWIFSDAPDKRYDGVGGGCDLADKFDAYGGRLDTNIQPGYGGPFNFPSPNGSKAGYAIYPQTSVDSVNVPINKSVVQDFPGGKFFGDSQYGFRAHTLLSQTWELTALYYHGHSYGGATINVPFPPFTLGSDGKPIVYQREIYPQFNDAGVTLNRPLTLPGTIGEMLPFVLRAESVWQDHTPLATRSASLPGGLRYSGTINSLVALDLDSVYLPQISKSSPLTVNLEWNNDTVLSPNRWEEQAFTFLPYRHNESSLLFGITDAWWYGAISPFWGMIYNPDGNTFLLFPSLTLTPPWTAQYFFTLGYIGIISNNIQDSYIGANLKGKNMAFMRFQWNFNAL